MKKILIEKVNRSKWWHVKPKDKNAYKKRGKFLASTFRQAEFYGRPNNGFEQVEIKNPVFGFSELEILKKLFDNKIAKIELEKINVDDDNFYKNRITLDSKIHNKAKELGFDSIILMTEQGKKSLKNGRKPNSIELNLIF